jgi:protein involved in polysaccharide export with SLBB domain
MHPLADSAAQRPAPVLSIQTEISTAQSKINTTNEHALILLTDNPEVLIEDGDELHVPAIERYVYVGGAVRTPGACAWVAGQKKDYYISMAGGYARNADRWKTETITRYGSASKIARKNAIDAGDILTIPEKDREKRFRLFLSVLGTLALVTSSSVSIASFIKE